MSAPPQPETTPIGRVPTAQPVVPPSVQDAPTEALSKPAAGRKISFDVLRIGFVLLVVLYHATFIGPLVYPDMIARNWLFPHQVGASLLLMLSAYFVAATVRKHGRREGSGRWWWGKIARLLPAFFVATTTAYLALRFLAPDGWYLPTKADYVANMLMLWNWNGLVHWDYVDGSYWTIPLQLMAFTLAALIWRTPLGRGLGLRVLMWAALLFPILQWSYRIQHDDTVYSVIADGFGFHRWHLFVAGVAVWLFATGRIGRLHITALLGTAMGAHLLHTAYVLPDGTRDFDHSASIGIALGMLALLAAAAGPDWSAVIPRVLRPTITWLAGISYGVFLVHQTLGYVFMRRIQELGAGPTLQTGAMVGMSVLLGWLITRLVEQPMHGRLLAWWDAARPWVRTRPRPLPARD